MRNIKNLKKFIILPVIIAFLAGCGKIPTLQNGEEAVATLKEESISAEALYQVIKEKYGIESLVDLIDEIILKAKFGEENEDVDAYVDEQLSQLKQSATDNNMAFTDLINYYGFKDEESVKDYLALTYMRNEAVEEYIADSLTDKEIKKYYDEEIKGEINVKHILISPDSLDGMTTEEIEEANKKALNEAKDIIKKLKNGEDFDELAKEYSDDTASAEKGGDLGWISKGETVAEFEEAAYALKKGTYTTSPVKTTYGYHIIYKVDEKEKDALDDVKDEIIEALVSQKLSDDSTLYYKTLEEIRKDSDLEIVDSDLKSAYKTYMNNLTTAQK